MSPPKPFRWFRLRHMALAGGNSNAFQYGSISLNLPTRASILYDATYGLIWATTVAFNTTGQPYWSPGPWIELDPTVALPDPFTITYNAFASSVGNLTTVNSLFFHFEFLEDGITPSFSS